MATHRTVAPDALADAEFVGLFNGEGHLDLMKASRGRSLMPRARIGLRDDDIAVLHWCRDRFGGSISPRLKLRAACWQVTGRATLTEIVDLLLSSRIPAKKRQQAVLMRQAFTFLPRRGEHISDAAVTELRRIRDLMKADRAYLESA